MAIRGTFVSAAWIFNNINTTCLDIVFFYVALPVLVVLSCLLKGTMTHRLSEFKSRALDAGGWGCCSTSCWQEMALLLMLPVGELKLKEWKVNNIHILPKFLYKLSCVRIYIGSFLTWTWYTSLTVFQMGEEIAGKPSLTSEDHANPNMEQLTIIATVNEIILS